MASNQPCATINKARLTEGASYWSMRPRACWVASDISLRCLGQLSDGARHPVTPPAVGCQMVCVCGRADLKEIDYDRDQE